MTRLIQRKQIDIGVSPFGANTSVPATNTVANTATETAFASSIALPANGFKAGDFIQVIARGVFGVSGTLPTLRLKLKVGATVVLDTSTTTGIIASLTNGGWGFDATLLYQGVGTSGSLDAQGTVYTQNAASGAVALETLRNATAFTLDTTVAAAITLTATWSAAATGNTITLRQLLGRYN